MNKIIKKNLVIFASGRGTNFINIYNKLNTHNVNGEIVLLISNNKKCGAVIFANVNNINYEIVNINSNKSEEGILSKYEMLLEKYSPDLILLAGFMKKIPIQIIRAYKNKILNIHPSLLPKYGGKGFYGLNVHKAVIESKDRITGVTVHFVDDKYDNGPILLQKKVSVKKDDSSESLSKRVLLIEYEIYFEAVKLFCNNLITIENDRIKINEKNK